MSLNINPNSPNIYKNPKREITKTALTSALVGCSVAGAAEIGLQYFTKSKPMFLFEKAIDEVQQGKRGFYSRFADAYTEVLLTGKFDYKRLGKVALISGAAIGFISALASAYSKLPNQTTNYSA